MYQKKYEPFINDLQMKKKTNERNYTCNQHEAIYIINELKILKALLIFIHRDFLTFDKAFPLKHSYDTIIRRDDIRKCCPATNQSLCAN